MAGKAGSLLIDIAADVGHLRQDFNEAKQQVSQFGEAVAGIGRMMATAFAGLGIASVVSEVNSLISDVQRIAVEADKVAQRFRLTTDQAQALQLMAERTGASIEHLVKLGERNPQWLRETTDAARQAGLVIDQEFVKGLANAAERTADLERRAKVAFAGIAEAAKRAAVFVAEVFGSAFGGGQSIERLETAIGHMREAVRNLEGQRVGVVPEVLERKRAELAQMETDLATLQRARETLNAPLPEMPPTTITAKRGGGGAGRRAPEVDRFASTIESLREELRALEQGADDTAQRVAKAVRSARVTDPGQIKQIRELVEQIDQLRVAQEVQKEFGDGSQELATRIAELDSAYKAGAISAEAYANAARDAQETQAGQADQMAATKGGVEAISAGWNTAMREATSWQQQFQMGAQLFSGSMNLMAGAISEFVRTGTVDFGKLAESFAAMLADMAARWAAASILQSVLGLTGVGLGGGGGLFGSLFSLFGGGLQNGGPVQAGRSYVVGEAGPERFVPTVPGTIVPNQRGGDTNIVNVDMGTTAGATDPAMALAFGRKIKAAVKDVISNEKRPGGTLYTRTG